MSLFSCEEEAVHAVLNVVYRGLEPVGARDALVTNIASTLKTPAKRELVGMSYTSAAASEIRELFWDAYAGPEASAFATCSLFYYLDRAGELGQVRDSFGYDDWHYARFLFELKEIEKADS